jgi:hypothetical protein
VVDSFALRASAWEAYYGPVEARANELDTAPYADDPDGRTVLDAIRHEINVFRRHGTTCGYLFLVLQA